MNQKHILFFYLEIFQPPSLPQNFTLLLTPLLLTPLLPTFPLLLPSLHFLLIPSPELKRVPELE